METDSPWLITIYLETKVITVLKKVTALLSNRNSSPNCVHKLRTTSGKKSFEIKISECPLFFYLFFMYKQYVNKIDHTAGDNSEEASSVSSKSDKVWLVLGLSCTRIKKKSCNYCTELGKIKIQS